MASYSGLLAGRYVVQSADGHSQCILFISCIQVTMLRISDVLLASFPCHPSFHWNSHLAHLKNRVAGSSADRVWISLKYAWGWAQLGHATAHRDTTDFNAREVVLGIWGFWWCNGWQSTGS